MGNELFGRQWKKYDEDDKITLDTVPNKKRNREVGKALEAFSLSEVVEEIMKSEGKSTVVYHDDGSKTQGAGYYSVQGVSIDSMYYPFLTLSLASETRSNLAALKLTILNTLSVCSSISADVLWTKIDFVMRDSTSHNLLVEDLVAKQLESEHLSHTVRSVAPICSSLTSTLFS